MGAQEELLAVGPLDGRYAGKVAELAPITSEFGLIERRVAVETGWLAVIGSGVLPDVKPFSEGAKNHLASVTHEFDVDDAVEVKEIEKTTNHDVKAVEVWLRNKLGSEPEFQDKLELIHFGCTSEDINNLAYAMMLRDVRDNVLLPGSDTISDKLWEQVDKYAGVPMLARTHGQPATPTTLGKEMEVYRQRINDSATHLEEVKILGKFNGASGNYNAATFAYPEVDWRKLSENFVTSLGFEVNTATTQIEPHDWMARFNSEVALSNTIMTDMSRDIWQYISIGYFKQHVKAGEVGSSTMPHKVNPIDFENAEANFGLANATLIHLAGKLPVSRLQRDLSDSSAQRAYGEAFGHTVVAHSSLLKGLGKIEANPEKMHEDLAQEWPILTEALQTVMRRYGVENAYEIIKGASRGQSITENAFKDIISKLDIPDEAKERLSNLEPSKYIGLADKIARGA